MKIKPGYWSETVSGFRIRLDDLDNNVYALTDIACSLSRICRFGGHVNEFYSVAQPCVLGSWKAPDHLKLAFLMHDCTEAYIGDIIRPVKKSIPGLEEFEDTLHAAILKNYGLPFPMDPLIHEIDNRMLVTEAKQLRPDVNLYDWGFSEEDAYDMEITPWLPETAEKQFLRYFELYSKIGNVNA